MPRSFKIRKELIPYLMPILQNQGIESEINGDCISVELSGNIFHRYVKQAVCEKQRIESQHPEIPVFPKEVVFNDRALLKLTKGKLYFGVLKEEYQGIMERLRARNSRFFVPPDQLDPWHPEIFPCCRLICCEGAPVGSYMENNRQIICNNLLVVYTKEKTWYYPVR